MVPLITNGHERDIPRIQASESVSRSTIALRAISPGDCGSNRFPIEIGGRGFERRCRVARTPAAPQVVGAFDALAEEFRQDQTAARPPADSSHR